MTTTAEPTLPVRRRRYRRLMTLLDQGVSLRAAARVLGVSPTRAAQIRDAGDPRPVGRPRKPRDPESISRLLDLWEARIAKRKEAGMSVDRAEERVAALRRDLTAARREHR